MTAYINNKSEHYKEYIRGSEYDEIVTNSTTENVIIASGKRRINIEFTLEFSFSFENGFYYTNFSDFEIKSKHNIFGSELDSFINLIKKEFVDVDRLSC